MAMNTKSIFPVSNIKKSCINRPMAQSANPFMEPGINEINIRTIDDSQEIDLENHMQKMIEQDL